MFRNLLRSAGRAARRTVAGETGGMGYYATRRLAKLAEETVKSGNHSQQWGAIFALGASAVAVPFAFASAQEQRSFIMVKPDGVQRGLVSEIIGRFESKGYKLVGIKVIVPSKSIAEQHYAEHEGKPFYPKLVDFLSSGPVIAMVWEGKEVIKYGRTMIGATNPLASAPGTIRGDFGIDMGRNIIHGSDSVESAQREIALWFKTGELATYSICGKEWIYE